VDFQAMRLQEKVNQICCYVEIRATMNIGVGVVRSAKGSGMSIENRRQVRSKREKSRDELFNQPIDWETEFKKMECAIRGGAHTARKKTATGYVGAKHRTHDVDEEELRAEDSAKGNLNAKAALDHLVGLGCDRKIILQRLFMFCGGDPADVRAVKKEYRRRHRYVQKVSRELETLAPRICTAHSFLSPAVEYVSWGIDEVDLESEAKLLVDLANVTLKDLGSGRVTARDHHLVTLKNVVVQHTGEPHWPELAYLAAAIKDAYDPDDKKSENYTADGLRRRAKRSESSEKERLRALKRRKKRISENAA
jgi:hypothetical protein